MPRRLEVAYQRPLAEFKRLFSISAILKVSIAADFTRSLEPAQQIRKRPPRSIAIALGQHVDLLDPIDAEAPKCFARFARGGQCPDLAPGETAEWVVGA